ncbi:MAG: DsbA family protein [Buchnera aphidicola (Eriosoma harunire)]
MKTLLIIISILFSCNLIAEPFIEGKHYTRLPQSIEHMKPITEFFSFLCPHCYVLINKFQLNKKMEILFSQKHQFNLHHINFFNEKLEKTLTHIWYITKVKHLEKKTIHQLFKLLYNNVHINDNIIKNEIIKNTNLTKKKFNLLWNSYSINYIIQKNKQLVEQLYLPYIPATIINGKYIIKNENLNTKNFHDFIQKYLSLVQFLIQKK